MAEAGKKEKEPINIVHQNAQFRETVHKERKNQKVFQDYSINPYNKAFSLSGKPNSKHDSADGEEDATFLKVYRQSIRAPQEKYDFPQTEAQEVGWDNKPLVKPVPLDDRRLQHGHQWTGVTQYMEAVWTANRHKNEESES
ncbi:cilia- and flagella-associated protein 144-like [Sycon ciliatum]|uniref:cilia- and flagella-associated protein 144-like n=1 Tax=Sycon ciliatum TaxID=27933 RepID=UPI0020AEE5BB|eukprot:scpid85791/ scgid8431/ Protein FAM183A